MEKNVSVFEQKFSSGPDNPFMLKPQLNISSTPIPEGIVVSFQG